MTFVENYKLILEKYLIISKISTFLIFAILVAEISYNLYEYLTWKATENVSQSLIFQFKIAIIFQIIIAILFSFRFYLLWIKTWYSQFFWLAGWVTILGYYLVSQITMFGTIFSSVDVHSTDIYYAMYFLWTYKVLTILLLAYLIFSPIKQISTILFAYFYRK